MSTHLEEKLGIEMANAKKNRAEIHVLASDVGQGQCQEKFFKVGRSNGRRGVGWRRALSDGGQRTDGSFYFFLEPPLI